MSQSTRNARKLKGLCTRCGKNPPRDGLLSCASCSKESSIYDDRKSQGLCTRCGQSPPEIGVLQCSICSIVASEVAKTGRKNLKTKVFNHYGNICACCGKNDIRFLTIDHIDGGGSKHRKSIGNKLSSQGFYNWLIKNNFPPEFQPQCFNCNCGRAANGGICPHKETENLEIPNE